MLQVNRRLYTIGDAIFQRNGFLIAKFEILNMLSSFSKVMPITPLEEHQFSSLSLPILAVLECESSPELTGLTYKPVWGVFAARDLHTYFHLCDVYTMDIRWQGRQPQFHHTISLGLVNMPELGRAKLLEHLAKGFLHLGLAPSCRATDSINPQTRRSMGQNISIQTSGWTHWLDQRFEIGNNVIKLLSDTQDFERTYLMKYAETCASIKATFRSVDNSDLHSMLAKKLLLYYRIFDFEDSWVIGWLKTSDQFTLDMVAFLKECANTWLIRRHMIIDIIEILIKQKRFALAKFIAQPLSDKLFTLSRGPPNWIMENAWWERLARVLKDGGLTTQARYIWLRVRSVVRDPEYQIKAQMEADACLGGISVSESLR